MLSLSFRTPIEAPVEELARWHARPGAFERLAPPWNEPTVIEPLDSLHPGARTRLQLALGPIHQEMVAEICEVTDAGFTDTQLSGPFQHWTHHHRFHPRGTISSELEDSITCEPPLGAFGHLSEAYARSQIERVFAWRHRLTRLDLERGKSLGRDRSRHLLVSGGTGLVGRAFQHLATTQGHRVTVLTRTPSEPHHHPWDPARDELDLGSLGPIDAVVHLAGAGVTDARWNQQRKRAILESRTLSTALLARRLADLPTGQRPEVMVCASGISGLPSDGRPYDESEPLDRSTFLGEVVAQWEAAAAPAREAGLRTVHARIAPVLDPRGGLLARLLPLFRTGVGGPVGKPGANFAWVALEDLVEILLRTCLDSRYEGAIHAAAPHTPSRRQFAAALGSALDRPAITPAPVFAVRLAMGRQMADETALADLHPIPGVLEHLDYPFRLSTIRAALETMLGVPQMDSLSDHHRTI